MPPIPRGQQQRAQAEQQQQQEQPPAQEQPLSIQPPAQQPPVQLPAQEQQPPTPPPPPPLPNTERIQDGLRIISGKKAEVCEELSRLPNLGSLMVGLQNQLADLQQQLGGRIADLQQQLGARIADLQQQLEGMRQEMQQGFNDIQNSLDDKEVLMSIRQYNANKLDLITIPPLSRGPLPIDPPKTASQFFNLDAQAINALCVYYGIPLVGDSRERCHRLALYLSIQWPPLAP